MSTKAAAHTVEARVGAGRPGAIPGERIIRFEFPETPGALAAWLVNLRPSWFLTLLHYRNRGGQVGKVLAGIRVPESDRDAYQQMLDGLGYKFFDETDNVLYKDFMC